MEGPELSTAPLLPPGGDGRNNTVRAKTDTSVVKQAHKKIIILAKHMNPRSLMTESLEINLGGKYFNNGVHLCTPLH